MKIPTTNVAFLAMVLLATMTVQAATFTFVPGGGNDWWVTASNWDLPGIPNSINDVAVFDASTNPSYSTNTHSGNPYTVQELLYNTTSTWRMHNNERDINLEGPGTSALVTQNGSGAITFDCDLKFTDTTTFTGTGTGNITVNGSVLTGPGDRLGLFGPGGLIKEGSYTLTVNPAGSYAGGTTINQGTIVMGNSAALGTGAVQINAGGTLNAASTNPANPITLSGGTLYVANGASGQITLNNVAGNTINANGNYRVLSGQITGPGGFTFGGINVPGLGLSNPANDFQGDINVNANAYLRVDADEVIPDTANLTLNGQLRLEGNNRTETIAGLNGTNRIFAVNGGGGATLRFGAGGASGTHSGSIGLGGANNKNISLVKIGAGTQTLSGVLDHTGSTTVDGGILRLNRGGLPFPGVGATGQFTSPHTVTVNSGATLQVNATWVMGDGVANKIVVDGGTLEFLNSDNYMGNIELTGGAITTSGGSRPWRIGYRGPGLITVNASAIPSTIGGTLCFVGNAVGPTTTFDVAGGGEVIASSHIYDHPGFEGAMRVVKEGAGKLTLTSTTSSWDGGLSINGGTVSVPTLTGGNTNGSLGGWYGTSAYFSFDGGTLEYTGGTVGGINRAFLINAGGATIDVTNPATTLTWTDAAGAGPITGPGALTKAGPGTLLLTGANNYAGGTIVDDGTLAVGNVTALGSGLATVNAAGTLDLGSHNVANGITLGGGTLWTANGVSGTITLNNVAGNTINANGNYRVLSGQITGPGGVTIGGSNTPGIALSNPANDFQGDVSINGGAYLRLNADEVIPDTANVMIGGYLRLEGANRTETINALNGGGNIFAIGNNTLLRVGADNGSGTFGGNVGAWWDGNARSIGLVKLGDGTQTLSGGLYYSGPTTVDGGTLRITGGVGFPGTGSTGKFASPQVVTVNSGATLQINGDWITGDGQQHELVANGGTIEFTGSDNYQSKITLTGGHVTTNGGLRPWRTGNYGPGLITVNPSATSSTIAGSLCFVGTAAGPTTTFDVADGAAANDLVVSSQIFDHPGFEGAMRVVKDGAGLMVFSGNNTYAGGTTISQGTLQLGQSSSAGTGVITLGDANTGANEVRINMPSNTAWPPPIALANDINVSNLAGGRAVIAGVGGTWAAVYRGTITLQNKDVIFRNDISGDRTAIEGKITGTGNVTIEGSGRVNFVNSGSDFVGDVTIVPGATLQTVLNNNIPDTADVTVNGRLGLYRTNDAIDALHGSGLVNSWSSGQNPTLTVGADNGSGTFSGSIQNGGGTLSLIKTGTGTQTLTGNGGAYVFGGITVDAGVLQLQDNGDGGGNGFRTSVINNADLWLTSTGPRSDFRASISGTGTITKKGPGMVRLGPWGGVAQVTGSGDIVIESGILQSAGRSDYRMFDTTGDLIINPGATFDYSALNDFSPATASRFGALSGSGDITVGWGTHYVQFGNGDSSGEFSGTISGDLSVTKIGAGTQTLIGNNTYTGMTTVEDGTLLVDGSVGGGVTVNPGGTVSAGQTVGQFIVNGTYDQTGTLLVEINGYDRGTDPGYDYVDVSGVANVGGLVDIDLLDGFLPSSGTTFDVLTATSVIDNGIQLTWDDSLLLPAQHWTYSIPGGNTLQLQLAVPEPSSLVLAALGLLGLGLAGRRRRRRGCST